MVCLQKTQPEMASAAIYEFQRAAVIDPTLGDPNNKPDQLVKYADDLVFPGMLHGRTIRTTIPSGRITNIRYDFDTAGFTIADHRDDNAATAREIDRDRVRVGAALDP